MGVGGYAWSLGLLAILPEARVAFCFTGSCECSQPRCVTGGLGLWDLSLQTFYALRLRTRFRV